MSYKVILQRLIISACLVYMPVSLAESPSTDEIIRQAQERAAKIEEYRRLLSNPDQNVRIAGLDVMLKSDDPAMREIAFNIAFTSADDTMRAVALRNKFSYMKNLNFKLSLSSNPTKEDEETMEKKFNGFFSINLESYDANSGEFVFDRQKGKGQVSGIALDFKDVGCLGKLILGEGAELIGTIFCNQYGYKGTFDATLRLQ